MGRWDIQPSGVQGVLARTQGVAGGFDGQMQALQTALEGAGSQASSGIIGQALSGFVAASKPSIDFVFTRTGAALTGAANATNAYLQGDLEMAANAQAAASAAPDPTMPGGRR